MPDLQNSVDCLERLYLQSKEFCLVKLCKSVGRGTASKRNHGSVWALCKDLGRLVTYVPAYVNVARLEFVQVQRTGVAPPAQPPGRPARTAAERACLDAHMWTLGHLGIEIHGSAKCALRLDSTMCQDSTVCQH